MSNKRHKDGQWNLPTSDNGAIESWDYVKIALLMDLRDELKKLNRVFECPNFTGIPRELRAIHRAVEGMRRDLKEKAK